MSDTESKSEKAADKVKDKSKKSKSSKGKGEVHTFMVNSMKFVIDSFYKPLKPLGRGAYGVVWSVSACCSLNSSNTIYQPNYNPI